ncbi:MAG: hypothetical protein L0Y38_11190 [Methylococcaceae bacterium]|nr:hypothetical protein [Methylococcaceae bacterium]
MNRSSAGNRIRGYTVLGLLLLAAYLVQDIFALKWPWLAGMQTDENFKRLTGFLLAGYILHQWSLSLDRMKGPGSETKLSRHMAWGAWAPLVFYIHSHQIGYAYLFLLSSVFLANVTIGLLNHEVVGIHKKWYLVGWMVAHVSLSVMLVLLAGYHGFMAFYYQ